MVAGEGVEREAIAGRIDALGLHGTVRLLGRVGETELPLAYRAADLTVVPSVALEGFGLIVPESLAAGTPVLVTPVGGLPETVEGLSDALVLAGDSPAAIAEGIAAAFAGLRAGPAGGPGAGSGAGPRAGARPLPSAEACAAFARERYDWRRMVARTAALYRSLA
jgi:glycosyltransferase involved in cell wall biosynthesis